MAASTRSSRNQDRQASYQPGGDYESWNTETGRPNQDHDYSAGRDSGDSNVNTEGKSNAPTAQQSAISSLRSAENSAASGQEQSYFTGKGKQNSEPKSGKKKLSSRKKGIGAIITIAIILTGAGAFLGASNSLLAPALSSLLTSATQTNYTSYYIRTQYLTSGMMKGSTPVTTGWSGVTKYTKMPTYLQNRLKSQGIEPIGEGGKITSLRWKDQDISANQFTKMFNDDVDFRDSYLAAKRGRVASFFDKAADKIYKKLGISRNLFNDYKQTNSAEADTINYKDTGKTKFDGDTADLRTFSDFEWEELEWNNTTEEWEWIPKYQDYPTNGSSTTGSASDINIAEQQANSMINSVAGSAAKHVGQIGSTGCTIMRIGSMIAAAVSAQEMYQSINYFMVQMESISKMMAGYGDASAVNSLLNFLSTATTTKTPNYKGEIFNPFSSSSTKALDKVTDYGSPLEASGMLLSTANASVSSSTTTNYSSERIVKAMGGSEVYGAGTATSCAGIDTANSIASIAVTLSPAGLVKIAGSFLTKTILSVAMSMAAASFFQFLIPTVAQAFFTNIFAQLTGIPAGQEMMRGASAANTRIGRSGSGQSLSSEAVANAYNRDTNTVLALEAESDRNQLSPFDISNRNTFFGSIAYSLMPAFTSSNMTGLASFIRSASSSLSTLVGKASAEGSGTSYMTTYGDCPLLKEIGAVGDLYCNPVPTTDMGTVTMEPGSVEFQKYVSVISKDLENCDKEGNCSIKPNSDLAYYISFCDNRDSPFGFVDQNILGSLEVGNAVTSSIPIIGDLQSIVNAGIDLKNIDWANGTKCGNTEKNRDYWNNTAKYLQRYIEDMRILEQMGALEKGNPVAAYEDAYEEQYLKDHPKANTYVGYLSRISGLTIENTKTVLAFVTYYDFVDKYDPSVRIAMDGTTSDTKTGEQVVAEIQRSTIKFEDGELIENSIEDKVIAHTYVVYADVRNRSYAA